MDAALSLNVLKRVIKTWKTYGSQRCFAALKNKNGASM